MTLGIYNEHSRGSDWKNDRYRDGAIEMEGILMMVLEVIMQIILVG